MGAVHNKQYLHDIFLYSKPPLLKNFIIFVLLMNSLWKNQLGSIDELLSWKHIFGFWFKSHDHQSLSLSILLLIVIPTCVTTNVYMHAPSKPPSRLTHERGFFFVYGLQQPVRLRFLSILSAKFMSQVQTHNNPLIRNS